jgi:hypothetical protein
MSYEKLVIAAVNITGKKTAKEKLKANSQGSIRLKEP